MFKLIKNLKIYWLSIFGIILFIFIQAISELFLPTLMSDIVDIGIVNGDIDYILHIGGWMILIAFIAMISSIAGSFLSAKVATGFGRDLRKKIFTRVESFSLSEFDERGTSSLVVRTTNDVTQIQRLAVTMFRMFLRAPLLFVGGVIMAFSKDAELSLILIAILPILALAIFFINRKSTSLFTAIQNKVDQLNLVLREYLAGIRVIRAFNREIYEKNRFDKSNLDLTETTKKVNILMSTLMPLMMLVLNLTIVAILWLGGVRINSGNMQVGDLMAFIQYASQIMFSLIMVSMIFIMLPRALVSAVRINEILDVEPGIKDVPIPEENRIKHMNGFTSRHHRMRKKGRGCLEFDEVSFRYQDAQEPVLNHISFQAYPGELTAIIGSTGSGKSTLINLIPRFYDVTSGRILIDGTDIREISLESLRTRIGLVPQKTVLFSGTIADNIRFGNKHVSQDEIIRVATVAQASEFISAMQKGYLSDITQGGSNLSGGQKQRLAIARALARYPDIYIFDDSFSALDFKTEANMRTALRSETGNKIVIVIAQRVTTVMDADHILVLDNGRITGRGTHRELIKTCEVYREIVSSQLSEEVLA